MKRIILPLAVALLSACNNCPSPDAHADLDKEAKNKKAFEQIQQAYATGDAKLFDGVVADNMQLHNPDPSIKSTGKQAWIDGLNYYRGKFPDMSVKIERLTAEGDWVSGVLTVSGTNTGEVNGEPATGKKVSVTSIDVYRFENGVAVENYSLFDLGTFMQQMGMMGGEEPMAEKEHACSDKCKDGQHHLAHGEKGHVCGEECKAMMEQQG